MVAIEVLQMKKLLMKSLCRGDPFPVDGATVNMPDFDGVVVVF
jgi:hypothetical protein